MAITPRARSASPSDSSLFSAPRSLKEAVNCRFSNLRKTSAPTSRDSVRLRKHGVCSTAPAMRCAAARMSSMVTGIAPSLAPKGRTSTMTAPMELDSSLDERLLVGRSHPTDELFRLLVTSVTDYAIYLLDPAGHVVSWNVGAERIKGYSAADIVGRHFSVFYPQAQREAGEPAAALARAAREGRHHGEGWRVRKNGSRFWAEVVVTALRGEAGELRGFAKVTRDMTARQRERENEITLAAMFERTPFGVAMIDPGGRYLRVNPVFLRLFGYAEAELAQRTLGDLTHPEDAAAAWRTFEELVQGRCSQADFEQRMLRRNGQVL